MLSRFPKSEKTVKGGNAWSTPGPGQYKHTDAFWVTNAKKIGKYSIAAN